MIENLPEKEIIKIWQHQFPGSTELTTEGGEPIKVIYPGRINDDRGADFRDAVIATSRGLIKGDIEVHVKSSDWRLHRHHHDPVYNRVILHVVMWHNDNGATNLQNQENVPVLALCKYIKGPISRSSNWVYSPTTLGMPCLKAVGHLSSGIIAEFLDAAGEERFLAKATRFQLDLAQMEASQCLYRGMMEALGYAKNKLPFLELARRLPLRMLESMAQGKISNEDCLARQQALLLGTAGLLPSQRPDRLQHSQSDKWIGKLERLWVSMHLTEAMSANAWHLFKVRPNNLPVRRIVAMSYLILRYREQGIFEAMVNMVREASVKKAHDGLVEGLLIPTNGYWASHFDFSSSSLMKAPALLGTRRAADIIVNVILPFAFAWSKLTSQPELGRQALDLYGRCPRLVVNTVEGHLRNQLRLSSVLVNSAQRQQGLIHIYNTLCTQGRCNCCPLGASYSS